MKANLQITKKHTLFLLLFISMGCVYGQTWSSNPSLNTWTNVGNNTTFSCSFGQVTRYEVQARVTNLTSTSFTVQFRKMNGGTFGSAGTAVLVDNTECNTFPITGGGTLNYASGSTGGTFTNATHGVTAGTSKTFYVRIKPSTTNWFITLPITITASQAPQPNLVCGSSNVTPTQPIQNQNASFSYTITNNGNATYTGGLSLWWRSASTGSILGSNTISTLGAGQSHTFSHNSSPLTSPPDTYFLRIEKGNGEVVCSRTVTVVAPASANLVCGPSNVTPTQPIQNQNASFSYTITNNGNATYTGGLSLWWRSASTGSILGSNTISTLGAGQSHTFSHNSTPLSSVPDTYFLRIEKGNGEVVCSRTVTVVAPTSCVQGSGTPPAVGSPEWNATQYLCTKGIIQPNQNWTNNFNNAILRQDLAKICYLGLYVDNTPNSPAENFPVPFNDMQTLGAGNEYWFKAAKVLAYLQHNDDKTPFDRDFFNFNPHQPLERRFAIKMFLEAFNIAPSTSTQNPFSDIPTSDPMFGYIKKAHELNLVSGNQQYTSACTSGTCIHPYANLTRQDAFILLHRLLTYTTFTRPTISQLNNINSYFVPGNYRYATMSKVPDVDHGNFNHYQKTSFNISGRGLPLDFTHTYNSFLTELPKGYFSDEVSGQTFTPLGIGWTHTYNIYAVKIDGYTNTNVTPNQVEPPRIMFYYPDGSINVFNYNTNAPEGVGIYDVMSKTPISGGERIIITNKSQMRYVFENVNNGKFYFIRTIKDRNNNGVRVNWSIMTPTSSNRYRISSVQEEANNTLTGRSLTFNYASTILGYLSSVVDNTINRTIQFNVNVASRSLTSFTDAKGQVTTYAYDDINNYNKSNLLATITLPKGNKISNTYVNRKLTQSRTLNQANVATSTTNVNWTPSYSSSGFNSSATVTDPQGRNTSYTHNTLGNPTQISSPSGTSSFSNYAAGNNANLPQNITINGMSSSMSYDNRGNVLNVTKNGISNSFTYNNFNDVLTHNDGRGFNTAYSYDGNGNLSTVQRPSGGGSTTISRNSFGQVQSVTNPSGITTNFGFNTHGLTNQVSMPLDITTSATYDNASRLLSTTDANGKTTSFQYDFNDNLLQSTDANGQPVVHTYDANDNHLSIKNPKNETQTNTYNFADDLLASESFGPHTKNYTYNADGSLATHTRGNGTFTYSYNNTTGRLASDGHTSYGYDTRGNVTTITNSNGTLTLNYDNNDRMTSYSDYFGNTVAYQYDNNNNVTRITYPGNKQVNYVYDANNRCTTVTDWNNKVTTYTYLTDDRVSKITLPNGTFTDYTYDAAGRATGIINKKANGTIISSYGFTMDNAGNHLTETINEPSITAGLQTISNETINYGNYPFNLIQSQGSTNFTHNTAGAITSKANESFSYNIYDQMLTAPGRSFTYDGAGNRRSKTVGGNTTRYVLNILGMSQVLMETNANNAVQNHYVYGPTGLLYRVNASNTYHYYHYDYRGSTTAMTNEAQTVTHSYSYDPFGKVLANTEADANPYQYVGKWGVQYESPTLTFMRARYYDPTTGRFVSEDPVWHLNLYPYADNNPVMMIDPKGQFGETLGAMTLFAEKATIIQPYITPAKSVLAAGYKALDIASVVYNTNNSLAILKTQIELNALKTSIIGASKTGAVKSVVASTTAVKGFATVAAVGVTGLAALATLSVSAAVLATNPARALHTLQRTFGNDRGRQIWSAWYGLK